MTDGHEGAAGFIHRLDFVDDETLRYLGGATAVSIDLPSGREIAAIDFECTTIKDVATDGTALVSKYVGSEELICRVSASKGLLAKLDPAGSQGFGRMQVYRDEIVGVRTTETPGYTEIARWSLAGGFRESLAGIHPPFTSPSFSIADYGGVLACVTRGKVVFVLWSTGRVLGSVEPEAGAKFDHQCVLTYDGTRCIVSMGSGSVAVVDTRAFRIQAIRRVPSWLLAVSKDGRFCTSAGDQEEGNPLVTWEIESGRIVDATTTDTCVDALALSPNGSMLAWAGPRDPHPGHSQVFVRDLTGTPRTILGPIFHPRERSLAVADPDVATGSEAEGPDRIAMIADFVQGALLGSSYDSRDKPRVEIYDEHESGGHVTLHFVAHEYQYEHAQSGSDWAEHYLFAGYATFEGAKCGDIEITSTERRHLTEQANDSYDLAAEFAAWRAAAIARARDRLAR